jgi:hypothetical protein
MSGGSYDYFYSRLEQVAFRINGKSSCPDYVRIPLRHAFKSHLLKVAEALRAIEWNDSGDGDSEECAKIEACLGPGAEIEAATATARVAMAELGEAVERAERKP